MAAHLNKVILIGKLTNDATQKTSKSNKEYVHFRMSFGDKEYPQEITVLVYGKEAVPVAARGVKGNTVLVDGQLSMSKVTVDKKNKDAATIVSFGVQYLGSAAAAPPPEPEPAGSDDDDEDIPF